MPGSESYRCQVCPLTETCSYRTYGSFQRLLNQVSTLESRFTSVIDARQAQIVCLQWLNHD